MIEVEDLTKRFGPITAVDRVSLRAEKGEIVGFLGPNGAGKTTTIKMMTTLLSPTEGRVYLNGCDVLRDPHGARRSFGIVFQDPSLDEELTALENMQFHAVLFGVPAAAAKSRIEELLRFVELWDRRKDLVKEFSGGMRRRLEVARGVLHEPPILFLDEPTQGLDPQTRSHIWSYIQELNRRLGTTVFFTTHYMEEAERVAGRVLVIDHGKIAAAGTVSELKAGANARSLEEAFINLTGRTMRDEDAAPGDHLRMRKKIWTGR